MSNHQLRWMRPRHRFVSISSNTTVPIAAGLGLLVVTLCLPDGSNHGAQAADELAPVTVQQTNGAQPATLRDRLIVGLQARLKSEVAFVDLVALKVRTGKIPQRLVDETFLWARNHCDVDRGGRQQRPIVFFEPAMRLRAQKIGVVL